MVESGTGFIGPVSTQTEKGRFLRISVRKMVRIRIRSMENCFRIENWKLDIGYYERE